MLLLLVSKVAVCTNFLGGNSALPVSKRRNPYGLPPFLIAYVCVRDVCVMYVQCLRNMSARVWLTGLEPYLHA